VSWRSPGPPSARTAIFGSTSRRFRQRVPETVPVETVRAEEQRPHSRQRKDWRRWPSGQTREFRRARRGRVGIPPKDPGVNLCSKALGMVVS
jgi:hypothetical protein